MTGTRGIPVPRDLGRGVERAFACGVGECDERVAEQVEGCCQAAASGFASRRPRCPTLVEMKGVRWTAARRLGAWKPPIRHCAVRLYQRCAISITSLDPAPGPDRTNTRNGSRARTPRTIAVWRSKVPKNPT